MKAFWCGGYEAAEVMVKNCLLRDGSLFSDDPNRAIWTLDHAAALKDRFDSAVKEDGGFIEQLSAQLDGAGAEEIQLAAELLFIQQLGENDTGGEKSRENVNAILGLSAGTEPIPEDLKVVPDRGGVATIGAAKRYRSAFITFLTTVVLDLKSLPEEKRVATIGDPWAFLDLVNEIHISGSGLQRNALLHLVYPDEFGYMISGKQQQKLIKAFSGLPAIEGVEGTERRVKVIGETIDKTLGRHGYLYVRPVFEIWNSASVRWDEAVAWSLRFYEDPLFDTKEREYKLEISKLLDEAAQQLDAGSPEWLDGIRAALSDSRNNLVHPIQGARFLEWCQEQPDEARAALRALWGGKDSVRSVAAFLERFPEEVVSGAGTRLTVATCLLLATSATEAPLYKRTVHQKLESLLDLPEREHEDEEGDENELLSDEASLYRDWTLLVEELRLRLLPAGQELRDLLDAQGLAYSLIQGEPLEDWTEEERQELAVFRGDVAKVEADVEAQEEAPESVALPSANAKLASSTFLPQGWLQDILDLLAERRQVIFYGPPGTGKTFVARKMAELIETEGGRTMLVQFHPSYTYEDFFEGYRPVDDDGALKYELVAGPLKEMAESAVQDPDEPHVLIVDEINRGNIAKIFGELYFLLEYRDAEIRLQYSKKEFKLPENLFIIGTMNTADRSIALVDSALRRRFYFIGFDPTEAPVRNVFEQWLDRYGLEPEPAGILDALNAKINDSDFSIGPAYLMNSQGIDPDLDRVWKHSVLPLLEEHYFGTGRNVEVEFGVKTLVAEVAGAAEGPAPGEDNG